MCQTPPIFASEVDTRAANVTPTFAIQIFLRDRYTSTKRNERKEQDLWPAIRFGCARGARSLVSMQIALLHKLECQKMGWKHLLMFDMVRVRNLKWNPINIACPDKIYQLNNRSCQERRVFNSLFYKEFCVVCIGGAARLLRYEENADKLELRSSDEFCEPMESVRYWLTEILVKFSDQLSVRIS